MKILKIKRECLNCKKEAVPDKEKSNDNWIVYTNKCSFCGGEIKREVIE